MADRLRPLLNRRHVPSHRSLTPRSFCLSHDGSVAIQVALMMLVLLGFVALGVEITGLLLEHRKQQSASDSAVMAAVSVIGSSDPTTEGRAVSAESGYQDGVNGVTVTVANPPTSGAHAGAANYVEVTIQQTVTPVLTQFIKAGGFPVLTRSVAVSGHTITACVLALDGSAAGAIQLDNNAIVHVHNCGMIANSNSETAVNLRENSLLDGSVATPGGVVVANGAHVNYYTYAHASAATDPYSGMSPGTRPTTELTAAKNPSSALNPGYYPDGFDFNNNTNVTLNPGVYWIGSKLELGNGMTLTGSGVTLVIDGGYAIDTALNATVTMTAPTSGATKGILFYSSPGNSTIDQIFGNNMTLNASGALYFPSQNVVFNNNLTSAATACLQVVAKTVLFRQNGTVTLNASCSGTGVPEIGSTSAASLVE
jgi:Flp pilus assembly protein TadG